MPFSCVRAAAHAADAGGAFSAFAASGAGFSGTLVLVVGVAVDSCFFARFSARSWWCFDLPDAASATILV